MKKEILIALLLFAFSILALVSACSKQEESQSSPKETQMTEKQMTADESGNDSAEPGKGSQDRDEKMIVSETPETPALESTPEATPQEQTATSEMDSHQMQLSLARKSGCLACHAVDKKVVGPAWRDVSKRYKEDPDANAKLIAKVSKGGRGNWTDVVGTAAMPPYSPRVSDQDIALLVEFVLSLEK